MPKPLADVSLDVASNEVAVNAVPPTARLAPLTCFPSGVPGPTLVDISSNCTGCKHNRLWNEPQQREEPHGLAGRVVQSMGIFGYGLFVVVPLLYTLLVHAVIPVGDPTVSSFREQWVFALITNPLAFLLFTFLYTAAFLSSVPRERPFRQHILPFVLVIAAQIVFFAPVLFVTGTFDYSGIVSLLLFFLSLYVALRLSYPDTSEELEIFFRHFVLLICLYVPILVAYLVAYRETSGGLQSLLSVGIAFGTFIYRRIMLSKLDPMPLDIAQLFSGLWVQNMYDSVQILSFPQVRSPGVLVSIWLVNAFSNIAFLVFVSDFWIYKIRPPLKNSALSAFKCNFSPDPPPPHDMSFDPVNRGHDANVGGYRRRQFRFFFFRQLSQAVAMLMYLAISPILRYGVNKEYFPFSTSGVIVDGEAYRNSMIYAAVNFVFIIVVMFLGYGFLHKRHHQTYHEARELHVHDLQNHTRVGLIVAILTHNLIFALAIVFSPYCVFSSFRDCKYDSAFAT